ncbi:hypothetical protein [Flavobacterium cerinum]|uniref:Uncharacterized protein n=1 Tax=Flavobacterium cerinum TaxID=2502784 RepID=A0A3S3QLY4_9FLAO|nr:hypothetical protein [Flavobacterium cerinum]RWX01616.1 hypothetical protein EPI11_06610 [Flavobacterium cerinum]
MKRLYKFEEVLNDLMDYLILGDPDCLFSYKNKNNLPDDLLTEFTTNETGDKVVEDGIIVPLSGVENLPYTIYFNLSDDTPELLKDGNKLQVQQDGYCLKVESGQIYLFTMPYLRKFTAEQIENLKKFRTATIKLENGWYSVSVLGGQTIQQSGLEPTFEFIIKSSIDRPKYLADISYSFAI